MDSSMYERALGHTGTVVTGTKPEQLHDSTPCPEWDVRALLNHIVAGCNTFGAGGVGKSVELSDDIDHLGDDHIGAYEHAARSALEAFQQPGALDKQFTLPWGDSPGSVALGIALIDMVAHGWDLAQATGQEITIDEDIAQELYGVTSGMMEPKGSYPRGTAFGPPVEVSDDASASERLLGYLGRQPA